MDRAFQDLIESAFKDKMVECLATLGQGFNPFLRRSIHLLRKIGGHSGMC